MSIRELRSANEAIAAAYGSTFDGLIKSILIVEDMIDAFRRIASIEDKMIGGDWEEIEEVRTIARDAIAKATADGKRGEA